MSRIQQIAKRLWAGLDLRKEIEKIVKENRVDAGSILSVVENLKKARLRMVGGKNIKTWNKSFEIVSGTGTLSPDGCHIHIAIADSQGKIVGGHLKEGCVVKTTVEIVLLKFSGIRFRRVLDNETGYSELVLK